MAFISHGTLKNGFIYKRVFVSNGATHMSAVEDGSASDVRDNSGFWPKWL